MIHTEHSSFMHGIFLLLLFLCIIICGALAKLMASVVVPVVIAVMLAFILEPIVRKLNAACRVPWIIAELIVLVLLVVLISVLANMFVSGITAIIELYPRYEKRFSEIYSIFAEKFNIPFDKELSLFSNLWSSLGIRTALQNMAISLSSLLITFPREYFCS